MIQKVQDIQLMQAPRPAMSSGKMEEEENFVNWGRTIRQSYDKIIYPKTVEEITRFIVDSGKHKFQVRGAGIRHSWADIFADEGGRLVSLYPEKVAIGQAITL